MSFLVAFYGVLFKDKSDAAFSNYRLFEAVGYVISFAYQSHLCLSLKTYILLGVLSLGMIGYGAVELIEKKRNEEPAPEIDSVEMSSKNKQF